jgi:hypothetical protein
MIMLDKANQGGVLHMEREATGPIAVRMSLLQLRYNFSIVCVLIFASIALKMTIAGDTFLYFRHLSMSFCFIRF